MQKKENSDFSKLNKAEVSQFARRLDIPPQHLQELVDNFLHTLEEIYDYQESDEEIPKDAVVFEAGGKTTASADTLLGVSQLDKTASEQLQQAGILTVGDVIKNIPFLKEIVGPKITHDIIEKLKKIRLLPKKSSDSLAQKEPTEGKFTPRQHIERRADAATLKDLKIKICELVNLNYDESHDFQKLLGALDDIINKLSNYYRHAENSDLDIKDIVENFNQSLRQIQIQTIPKEAAILTVKPEHLFFKFKESLLELEKVSPHNIDKLTGILGNVFNLYYLLKYSYVLAKIPHPAGVGEKLKEPIRGSLRELDYLPTEEEIEKLKEKSDEIEEKERLKTRLDRARLKEAKILDCESINTNEEIYQEMIDLVVANIAKLLSKLNTSSGTYVQVDQKISEIRNFLESENVSNSVLKNKTTQRKKGFTLLDPEIAKKLSIDLKYLIKVEKQLNKQLKITFEVGGSNFCEFQTKFKSEAIQKLEATEAIQEESSPAPTEKIEIEEAPGELDTDQKEEARETHEEPDTTPEIKAEEKPDKPKKWWKFWER